MEYTSLVYYVFMDFEARPNFAKTKRGASGGFLPRPLLLRLRHPNSEKRNQPKFCGILSPENCFRKTSSALFQISSSGLLSKKVRILYNEYRKKKKNPKGFFFFNTPSPHFLPFVINYLYAISCHRLWIKEGGGSDF